MWGRYFGKNSGEPLFIRKRFGIGWTLNPNHPFTWFFMLVVLVIIVYSIFNQ